MKFLLPRVALTTLTLGVCSAGYAQEPVPIEFYRPLKNSVSVGVRMIGGNAKVKFGNQGTILSPFGGLSSDFGAYNNGGWAADEQSAIESAADSAYGSSSTTPVVSGNISTHTYVDRIALAADGSVITGPNAMASAARYRLVQTVKYTNGDDANTNYEAQTILGEYVNYNPTAHAGLTREWGYNSTAQIGGTPGNAYVDMSRYDVRSNGGTASAESDGSEGVELQFAHILKRYKRFEWGINFSAGASTINAKKRDSVRSTLVTTTDRYRIAGTDSNGASVDPSSFPFWWYSNSSNTTPVTTNTTGSGPGFTATEYTYNSQQAKFLYTTPDAANSGRVTTQNIDVDGYWQIKGAYYMLRVGPIIRFQIGKNWTMSVSAGAAGAYVGTRFKVDEYITLSDVAGTIRYQTDLNEKENTTEEKRFVPGYYADVNLERWLTVRTGVFVGYGHERLGSYTQTLRGRTADIDLGNSSGFRFGVITRF